VESGTNNNTMRFRDVGYGDRLIRANFTLRAGELNFMTGPSGAGKSTVALLAAGLIEPTSGIISCDYDATNCYVPQRPYFPDYNNYNVLETILKLRKAQHLSQNYDKTRTNINILTGQLFEDDSILYKRYRQLSGGEQQRISILFALSDDPDRVIADEPTASVDQANKIKVIETFNRLTEIGKTVLIITHDTNLLESFPGKLLTARNGIIEEGRAV